MRLIHDRDTYVHRSVNNRRFILCWVLIFAVVISKQGLTAPEQINEKQRQKIGLVLSGGGARGLAHIGVLKVLHELHVPVDCVVGTSMGALVGGTYAAGVNPEQIQQAIAQTDMVSLFDDKPPRPEIAQQIKRDDYRPLFDITLGYNDEGVQLPPGASAGYKFELTLKEMIGSGASVSDLSFDDLPTPYRAIGTDLETGEMKVFKHGDLPKVMRASMSLPAIIAPAKVEGRTYVDGGLVRNLPVDVGRDLCGERIIAVNVGTRPKEISEIHHSIDVAGQAIVILTEQNVEKSLKELSVDDMLITPDLDDFDSSSFKEHQKIIEQGEVAARAEKEALSRFAVSAEEYQSWLTKRQSKMPLPVKVTAITAEASGGIDEKTIMQDITVEPGKDFDTKNLDRDIAGIYGRGDFSYVGYSTITDEDNATVVIKAESKPWGPGYLKIGLGAAADFNSPTQFNLAMSYRLTRINSLGAEWRNDAQIGYDSFLRTEFMQPLQIRDGVFLAPYAEIRRNFIQFYQQKIHLGEFEVKRLQGGFDIGFSSSAGELRIGPYISNVRSEPDFGAITSLFSEDDASQAGLIVKGIYDQLDSFSFPRSGLQASANIVIAKEQWGSDDEYSRAQAGISGARSFGKNTFFGHLEWGDEISGKDDLPVYDAFKLGGPKRLSGLYLDQLTGSRYNLATLSYYRQYASLPSQVGRGMYFGMSLEAGRINDAFMKDPWEWVTSGGVFWGADTILGSLFIGYGYSSLNQSSLYLVIGPSF